MVAQILNGSEEVSRNTLEEIKTLFRDVLPEDLINGAWFAKLLNFALGNYQNKVTADYFQKEYPGLPPDAIVDLRIKLAKNYAALSGGTTSAAYTVAIAATIGKRGEASPVAIPAAIISLAADLGYTNLLQLRLAYDISVLYGHPLDYEDPQDLIDLINLAFGVEAGATFQKGLQRLAPECTRVFIKKTITGDTLLGLKALPVVGKYLFQRTIIKTVIPVVGIGLGLGLNYYMTGQIGKRARTIYRRRAAIEEAVREFPLDKVQNLRLLLDLIWLAIFADKETTRPEAWFLRAFITRIQERGSIPDLENYSKQVNFDTEKILNQLSICPIEERQTLFNAVCIAVVVDGISTDTELAFVREVAHRADVSLDEEALRELVKKYKQPGHTLAFRELGRKAPRIWTRKPGPM